MKKPNTLATARRGDRCRIMHVDSGRALNERLAALGLREGTDIEVINHSCLRGPVTVRAGKSTVALGHGMATRIRVAHQEARL